MKDEERRKEKKMERNQQILKQELLYRKPACSSANSFNLNKVSLVT
jgi:hypothetical protein